MSFMRAPPPDIVSGTDYIKTLHKYLKANLARLAPSAPPPASFLQQSYTLLTLGLDPSSQPLSRSVKIPLTLGFGRPEQPKTPIRPLLLRLPPDRLLYLLLRWQALPQGLAHVGRTDVAIAEGVPYAARGASERYHSKAGDVESVRSWVGSMRSVSMASMNVANGWFGKQEVSEDQMLLALYAMFTILPALLIHPPFHSDPPISDLVEAGGYTSFGGIDVRVPLDVMRNLQILELEGYDPRALLIPPSPNVRNLTVRDVQDADDWVEELLMDSNQPRFPNLRHLALVQTTLIQMPLLPLTSLTSLDLSHNLLNQIPDLVSLVSLTSLNLSHNLISSVRNPALGPVRSINLSNNRIDCLAGLEQIPTLERIDVRRNEIAEQGEVGRLAVLPQIKEIWCTDNALAQEEGWRTKLGVTFASEGRRVILDDLDWSWAETRVIDAELAASGKRRPMHLRQPTMPARLPGGMRSVTQPNPLPVSATPESPTPSPVDTLSASSPPSTRTKHKRRPRRVVDLETGPSTGSLSIRGATISEQDESELPKVKQRSKLGKETFQAPA